ncbi:MULTISPECIES: HD-GYP domain-containing protein [Paenibacillus]|uniref:Nucleotidyltransferase with HDIG domain n=1 Tax=Paenibacillus tundrae TaxID=528187 RepID=A0ABT9WI54_9BACL|nr:MULTISPECIES: HD domain-containing phosphohydrolase [Paenibacillus]MCG7376586.1 HD domain-containing protein [Paenibacillus sp. ACRSA]MCM3172521.1 HD domain-containing protein [Paenibacillus sp. MER 99-2]MDQ0172959.1 putative nucleotidyltransferase with HDIG domain [Paenibacillus tundrae]
MRIHIMNLQDGDRLTADTFSDAGLHVLGQGTVLKSEDITLLMQHRVDYVDIEPREEEITEAEFFAAAAVHSTRMNGDIPPEEEMKSQFVQTVHNYQSAFLEALTVGKFNATMVDDALQPMVEGLDEQKDVVHLLMMLERDDVNNYTHSIQVGLLSFYMATWLGYSPKECYQISRGGYLHDIGKCKVSHRIRNKTEPLTPDEQLEYQRHTIYGHDIIKSSMRDEATALVALQHHEREDGSGYPMQIKKDEIHPYTQIVSVADVYISMRSGDFGSSNPNLINNLRDIYSMGFGKLNEKPVQALMQHLLPNFIGKQVLLSNGEKGVIVMNNPSDIFKPLIKVESEQYRDLSKERSLSIDDLIINS